MNNAPSTPRATPKWFNKPRGEAMQISSVQPNKIIIRSNRGDTAGRAVMSLSHDPGLKKFILKWGMKHKNGSETQTKLVLSKNRLEEAFDLTDPKNDDSGMIMTATHGGNIAHHGEFIRQGKMVSFGGAGIGQDGELFLSLLITDKMQQCVGELIKYAERI